MNMEMNFCYPDTYLSLKKAHQRRKSCIDNGEALFKSIEQKSIESVRAVLKQGPVSVVNCHSEEFLITPLHLAIQRRWIIGIQELLSYGASIFSRNQYGQTPLHYAAALQDFEAIKMLLLKNKPDQSLDLKDLRGRTPLHDAAIFNSFACVTQLLSKGASPNVQDKNGETPLHKAASQRAYLCIIELMKYKGRIDTRDLKGLTPLTILKNNSINNIEKLLDHLIVACPDRPSGFPVKFNIHPIISPYKCEQTKFLSLAVETQENQDILLHPISQVVVLVKWKKIKLVYLFYVIFYLIDFLLVYIYLFRRFDCYSLIQHTRDNDYEVRDQTIDIVFQASITFQNICISSAHCNRIYHHGTPVMKHPIVILQFISFFLISCIFLSRWFMSEFIWERHLGTILVFLMGIHILLLMGKHPELGAFITLFIRVAQIVVKLFSVYLCLIMTFSLAMYLAFKPDHYDTAELQSNDTTTQDRTLGLFERFDLTFLKSLTMMIGELDLSEMVDKFQKLPITSHVLFFCFVLLISIILNNLVIALAVHDIHQLQTTALAMKLESMIDAISSVEQMSSCPIFNCLAKFCVINTESLEIKLWPRRDMKQLHLSVSLNERSNHNRYICTQWLMAKLKPKEYKISVSNDFVQQVIEIITTPRHDKKSSDANLNKKPPSSKKRSSTKTKIKYLLKPNKSDYSKDIYKKLSSIERRLKRVSGNNTPSESSQQSSNSFLM